MRLFLIFVVSNIVILSLSACAVIPKGPSVLVYPAPTKPFDVFQADEQACRQFARGQVEHSTEAAGMQSGVTSAAIGTAVGVAAGALIGVAAGNPGTGAAIGAGSGLLLGSAGGTGAAAASQGMAQDAYNQAYLQCHYAKGNQVPGIALRSR